MTLEYRLRELLKEKRFWEILGLYSAGAILGSIISWTSLVLPIGTIVFMLLWILVPGRRK